MDDDGLIDQDIFAVLSQTPGQWRKVAFVINSVASAMADGSANEDERYETVARRIELLVREGRLLAQGDIKKWRFSEIRFPI